MLTQPNAGEITVRFDDRPTVMVVDDDPAMCDFLHTFLSGRGYEPLTIRDPADAVERFEQQRPTVVLLDMGFPGRLSGLDALSAFKRIDRDVPVIVLSGQGRTATVVEALTRGATDFVGKPFEQGDLDVPLARALEYRQLQQDVAALKHELDAEAGLSLIGSSGRTADVQDLIDRVADTDLPVLVRGEIGTGKERVARAIAAASPRRDQPFVKINCLALPPDALDAELFGYERAALAGALQTKPGKFEFANGGTLFLDEVGALSLPLQVRVLQVLQHGAFARTGGARTIHVNVRVVAATNRDLDRAVAEGRFREDLYFRLNVVCITLPPLRERRDEIPAFVDHFLKKYAVLYRRRRLEISPESMRALTEYDWPGNLRELEQLIKSAVANGTDASIPKEIARLHASAAGYAAPAPMPQTSPQPPPQVDSDNGAYSLKDVSRSAAREAERELILKMLQQTRWNRKETAALLGISYKALLYKIKDAGLDKP